MRPEFLLQSSIDLDLGERHGSNAQARSSMFSLLNTAPPPTLRAEAPQVIGFSSEENVR
jgi:hypothetical protein